MPALPHEELLARLAATAARTASLHQAAIIRALEELGEAAGRVSRATVAAHPEIAWREITGMRHRLIHGYAEVQLDTVWSVVQHRLAPLIAALNPLIPGEDSGAP